jgi:hypothetical protein
MVAHSLADGGRTITQTTVERLEAEIRRSLGGRLKEFSVDARAQGLVLHGRSRTYHAKQLAQQAALDISGMPILSNDIRVS